MTLIVGSDGLVHVTHDIPTTADLELDDVLDVMFDCCGQACFCGDFSVQGGLSEALKAAKGLAINCLPCLASQREYE